MAAQFYARYIPPVKSASRQSADSKISGPHSLPSKKRKRNSSLDKHPSTKDLGHHLQDVTIIENDNQDIDLVNPEDFSAAVIRNIAKSTQTIAQPLDQDLETPSGVVDLASVRTDETRAKRKRKKDLAEGPKSSDNTEVVTDHSVLQSISADDEPKHKKIRSKFEKSSKLAAKLSRKKSSGQDVVASEEPTEPIPELHGLVPLPQPAEVPDDPKANQISALPDWLARPLVISGQSEVDFDKLPLSTTTVATLETKGLSKSFAIQSGVLPLLLPGLQQHDGDLCVSAATGSGKTLAYVLPMVESLQNKLSTKLRGLIVVPTRELVNQVRETLQSCTTGTGLKIGTAVGSKALKEEQEQLVTREQRYDPKGYGAEQKRNAAIEDDLMTWEDEPILSVDDSDRLIDFVSQCVSNVDILVCTPGRLVDHVKSTRGFTLEHVQWLVIDEADRLLDESFQQWVDIVLPALQSLPKQNPWVSSIHKLFHVHEVRNIRKIILSATITKDISKLMALQLRRPKLVVLENSMVANASGTTQGASAPVSTIHNAEIDLPSTLEEIAIPIKNAEDKPLYLLELLSQTNTTLASSTRNLGIKNKVYPAEDTNGSSSSSSDELHSETSSSGSDSDSDITSSELEMEMDRQTKTSTLVANHETHGILIFTNNNENALRLARLLALLRPSLASKVGSLTKSTASSTGRKTLSAFRKRKLSILIASDRASRGLDIQDLAQVINYDMPSSVTSYVHRVGRTARAGKNGRATTLVAHHEARWFWNEIARSDNIHRNGKIRRMEKGSETIGEQDRTAYEMALRTLGQEARGVPAPP
ncbi:ATP-dependent RNA helicase dbp6 [Xylographa carneopallida]|nr:ATP-dependent RNA helicase dbp6 [Xylographa carneopallida]